MLSHKTKVMSDTDGAMEIGMEGDLKSVKDEGEDSTSDLPSVCSDKSDDDVFYASCDDTGENIETDARSKPSTFTDQNESDREVSRESIGGLPSSQQRWKTMITGGIRAFGRCLFKCFVKDLCEIEYPENEDNPNDGGFGPSEGENTIMDSFQIPKIGNKIMVHRQRLTEALKSKSKTDGGFDFSSEEVELVVVNVERVYRRRKAIKSESAAHRQNENRKHRSHDRVETDTDSEEGEHFNARKSALVTHFREEQRRLQQKIDECSWKTYEMTNEGNEDCDGGNRLTQNPDYIRSFSN